MKATVISILVAVAIIVGAIIASNGNNTIQDVNANNVTMENGKQIVTINAKGGYQPRKSIAKADIPTIIRVNTKGTFDCSSSIRIPDLKISKILPQTGDTDIDIGNQKEGILRGSCGMGMYRFEVEFQK